MRAKFINEIVKGGKGLNTLGVGSIVMHKAYDICSKLDPALTSIFPMDSLYWKWTGALEKFPAKMAEIHEAAAYNLIHIKENRINTRAEEYLRVQAFSDKRDTGEYWPTHYVRKDTLELEWKPNESTTMHIYTNEILGVSYVYYEDLSGSQIRLYVFRTS